MADKKITYTDKDRAIVDALRNTDGLTLAEINEVAGTDTIKSGHINAAKAKGLITVAPEQRLVDRKSKRNVKTYTFVTAEPATAKDGKPANYSDKELSILEALRDNKGQSFTLAQIAELIGAEKLSSGNINGLVGKGNVGKGDEVTVEVMTKKPVNVYLFANEVPNA